MNAEKQNRYFVEISFRGTNYHGWQIQKNAPTVQQKLNECFSTVLREEIRITGAGRTDTGVHALYYVGHFDSSKENLHKDESFLNHINHFLPSDIAVHRIISVNSDAHARFSALTRTYEYWICRHKNPFLEGYAWMLFRKLHLDAMQKACRYLIGVHDFSSFCKVHSGAHTHICQVTEAYWIEQNSMLVFHITADRFLRNMVRAIVGTMIEIGKGSCPPEQIAAIIEARNRSAAGESVPAQGLFLTKITYPPTVFKEGYTPICISKIF